MGLDILITGIRIWNAIIIIILFSLLILPLLIAETVAIIFLFPIFAIPMSNAEIKKTWIGSYPNSPKKLFRSINKKWNWALNDLDETCIAKIILSVITGLFAYCLIISILTLSVIFLGIIAIFLISIIIGVVYALYKM